MNLHKIVTGAVGKVNPFVPGSVRISTGSVTEADGTRIPTYRTYNNVSMQVQALTGKDLQQIDGLNLNGTLRKIYCNGQLDATTRVSQRGGDLITLRDGPNVGVWLTAQVMEQWEDWCSIVVVLQNEPVTP